MEEKMTNTDIVKQFETIVSTQMTELKNLQQRLLELDNERNQVIGRIHYLNGAIPAYQDVINKLSAQTKH